MKTEETGPQTRMALQAAVMPLEGAPRIGVVPSATSRAEEAYRAAESLGLNLYPWQRYALWEQMATGPDGKWKYAEAAHIVARQNGKTTLLLPRVKAGLERGERIVHTAQNRIIPREVLLALAAQRLPGWKVREANGQEAIRTPEGGIYRIVAPQRGSRGLSADLLIIDELREFEDFDFIAAAEPILAQSANPQTLYLSNAGEEKSIVLNSLRKRGETDPNLAYLEWSAAPERATDDEEGWLEANPSIGFGNLTLARLRRLYEKYQADGELAKFETEYLCRWVVSMYPRLVSDAHWQMCRADVTDPVRPFAGISVDPSGQRVSYALAWQQTDGSIGLMARDFTGSPIDLTRLAVDIQEQTRSMKVSLVAYDPWTDQHLARHFPNAKAVQSAEFANASERFVRSIETGQIRWQFADAVSADLPYTSRKSTTGTAWTADRAKSDRSISAVLAAIRAVWLASNPQNLKPQLY